MAMFKSYVSHYQRVPTKPQIGDGLSLEILQQPHS